MAAIWAGIAAAVIGAGVGAAASQSPGQPSPLSQAKLNEAGVEAAASTLADERGLEAAAQQGIAYNHGQFKSATMTRQELGKARNKIQAQLVKDRKNTDLRQQRDVLDAMIKQTPAKGTTTVWQDTNGGFIDPKIATADFTGYGAADVAAANAPKTADQLLALQQKYGPQLVQAALDQEKLANPEGVAARNREYEILQEELAAKPNRPVADLLDKQVGDQLAAGKNLTGVSREVLDRAVAQAQAARGGPGAGPQSDYAEPMETGFEGEARQQAANAKAQAWLQSGATPEDVDYRRNQQELADLSSFVNGATPESQFQTLSGAQQGPAPYTTGQPLGRLNPNAGSAAQAAGTNVYGTNLQAQLTQSNQWMAGLSTLLSAAGTVAKGTAG